jgi:predicted methyltransferase
VQYLDRKTRPPLLTAKTAISILKGHSDVSLDLGLSRTEVKIEDKGAVLTDGSIIVFEDLKKIAERRDTVFFPEGGSIRQVALWDGHYYKLVPTEGAPTLEIDGIRMHRTKGTTPDVDAAAKVQTLNVAGCRVLDTCFGLGYTALYAFRGGASLVVSIEVRPEVMRIAELNPWSGGLFRDGGIHLLIGDSFTMIDVFPEGFFDCVVHDPPRIARAGRLYSGDFYFKMYRVLGEGGRLFHYTGEPGSRRRRVDLRRGVMGRLRQAGFSELVYDEALRGVRGERGRSL